MPSKTESLLAYARRATVIPVVTIEDARHGIPLARTLVETGLPVIEVTLRTPAALDAIAAMAKAVPDAIIGAGTITSPGQIGEATEAGARFLVSPGTPRRLAEALAEADVPAMPGCATVSEAMALADLGFEVLKFFPAEPSGGRAWLKSIAGPLPHLRFCPTGGLDAANGGSYLALSNVACIGGAWMATPEAISRQDLVTIARLARECAALRPAAAAA
jgi:2-dehydro-3-deoxyphosphogluconate aldolase / (4S)-4-hydroxy-2-oxoglutarate aldolase